MKRITADTYNELNTHPLVLLIALLCVVLIVFLITDGNSNRLNKVEATNQEHIRIAARKLFIRNTSLIEFQRMLKETTNENHYSSRD